MPSFFDIFFGDLPGFPEERIHSPLSPHEEA